MKPFPISGRVSFYFQRHLRGRFCCEGAEFLIFFILAIFSNESWLADPNNSFPQLINYFYPHYKIYYVDF